jgi:hypothetical protein
MKSSPVGERVVAIVVFGLVLVAAVALAMGWFLYYGSKQPDTAILSVGAGLCLIASALALGLLANAILRR